MSLVTPLLIVNDINEMGGGGDLVKTVDEIDGETG